MGRNIILTSIRTTSNDQDLGCSYDSLGNLSNYESEQFNCLLALIKWVKSNQNLEGAKNFLDEIKISEDGNNISIYKKDGTNYKFYEFFIKHRNFLLNNKLFGLNPVILRSLEITYQESEAFLESWAIVRNYYTSNMGILKDYIDRSADEKRDIEIEGFDNDYFSEDTDDDY
tara:strand:- start:205 stop:720 length:516 start_codon:yes stop_codon:yes gene_type:complete